MKIEIENRLHRVKIRLNKKKVQCPFSKECNLSENSYRCNLFYEKCSIYKTLAK